MTIVETTGPVTAGVDTHAEVHVAAVVDHLGGVLGIEGSTRLRLAISVWSGGCGAMARSSRSAWKALARMGRD
jgi:hypothetical protein